MKSFCLEFCTKKGAEVHKMLVGRMIFNYIRKDLSNHL